MLTGDVEARWVGGAIARMHAQRLWAFLPDGMQALVDDGQELIDRFVPGSALLSACAIWGSSTGDAAKRITEAQGDELWWSQHTTD